MTETDGQIAGPAPLPELRLTVQSTPLAVRQALDDVRSGLSHLNLSTVDSGMAELVLAEVMNNIVEHAFSGERRGHIKLVILATPGGLNCIVTDDGAPMPGCCLPPAKRPDPKVARLNLPEGGFGWALIRDLSKDLKYTRENRTNRLFFRLMLGTEAKPG